MEYSKSKLTKKERFKLWARRNAFYITIAVLMTIVLIGIAIVASLSKQQSGPDSDLDVGGTVIEWGLPVKNVDIIKNYSETELQENTAFTRWEIHRGIDFKLAANAAEVYSVLKGTVVSVTKNSVDGNVVTIEHEGGIRSIYGSLSNDVKVKTGDVIEKGTLIGYGSNSSSRESDMGTHLHFAMEKSGEYINPNSYLKFS